MPKAPPSTERALRILEFFALVRRPATATEIQAAVDMPQSSLSVMLHGLTELGYLERQPDTHLFRPTPRVTGLGEWLKLDTTINLSSDRLDDLRRRSGETVLVGRQMGPQVQYIRIVLPDDKIPFYIREGGRRPLSRSATGRVLLSTLSDLSIREIVRRNNSDATSRDQQVNESYLMETVARIRQCGISETDVRLGGEREYFGVAMLLPVKTYGQPISISIGGPRDRAYAKRAELAALLKDLIASERERETDRGVST